MVGDERLADDVLDAYASRLEALPLDDAVWVAELLRECQRARAAEAQYRQVAGSSKADVEEMEQDVAQVVLDAAEWLQTLWSVGYMGAGQFPASPCSAFPAVNIEDVLKSALLARIRNGRRPLPFPPPTRHGMPWHEVVESAESYMVEAELIREILEDAPPLGVMIDGCADWKIRQVVREGQEYVVQHQGKGPLYRLNVDPFMSRLERLPPARVSRIHMKERAGFQSYLLEWEEAGKLVKNVSLRALNAERAESEAMYWVASHAPELYGQIRFEVVAG